MKTCSLLPWRPRCSPIVGERRARKVRLPSSASAWRCSSFWRLPARYRTAAASFYDGGICFSESPPRAGSRSLAVLAAAIMLYRRRKDIRAALTLRGTMVFWPLWISLALLAGAGNGRARVSYLVPGRDARTQRLLLYAGASASGCFAKPEAGIPNRFKLAEFSRLLNQRPESTMAALSRRPSGICGSRRKSLSPL